jgi:hypothetical protein
VRLRPAAIVRLEGALGHGWTPSVERLVTPSRMIARVRSAVRNGRRPRRLAAACRDRSTVRIHTVPGQTRRFAKSPKVGAQTYPRAATRRRLLSSSTGAVRFAHRVAYSARFTG